MGVRHHAGACDAGEPVRRVRRLGRNAGCNRFIGSDSVDDGAIAIGSLGPTFRLFAEPEGVMDQEVPFLFALQAAASSCCDGERLQISNVGGRIAMIANREP